MKKKSYLNIFFVISIFMSLPLLGQQHFIGLQGGINLAQISNFESEFRYGTQTGVNYQYAHNEKYIFGVDFLLIERGASFGQNHTDEQGNLSGIILVSKVETDYISVPLKGGVVIGDKLSGVLKIGVVPSFLIDAKIRHMAYEGIRDELILDFEGCYQFDLGALIEIGANYALSSYNSIFASAGLFKSITRYDGYGKHNGIEFSVGTRVALK